MRGRDPLPLPRPPPYRAVTACERRSRRPRTGLGELGGLVRPASWPGSRRACSRPWDRSAPRYRCRRTRTWDSGARSLPNQVAAFVLGAIEGLVGERDETVGAVDPIVGERRESDADGQMQRIFTGIREVAGHGPPPQPLCEYRRAVWRRLRRSEEHTSELQSLAYLVCRLLLEKKKKKIFMMN